MQMTIKYKKRKTLRQFSKEKSYKEYQQSIGRKENVWLFARDTAKDVFYKFETSQSSWNRMVTMWVDYRKCWKCGLIIGIDVFQNTKKCIKKHEHFVKKKS